MTVSLAENALSVAGLTTYIQDLLEGDEVLHHVWVIGEVSSLNVHAKGIFLTLCDPQEEATLNGVIWNSQRFRLVAEPKIGEQILVLGKINLYPKRGEYRLTIWQTVAVGEGLQALRYQQLRSRLQQDGLFAPERKRPLPPYPPIIAIVTSPTAAAWGDIQRTLTQRYPGLQVLFSPATVQGENAPASIVKAIARVNRDSRAEVLILARGGGAVEDLSCFNDERVVRAIAESRIPVVTGIGHQRDQSLADLVADLSVHTPTAAAERVIPDYYQLIREHEHRVNRLVNAVRQQLEQELNYLKQLKTRLKNLPDTSRVLSQASAKCQLLRHKLIALDPQKVLQRGYAVVRNTDQKFVRSSQDLVHEQELTLQLGQGFVQVKVTKIIDQCPRSKGFSPSRNKG